MLSRAKTWKLQALLELGVFILLIGGELLYNIGLVSAVSSMNRTCFSRETETFETRKGTGGSADHPDRGVGPGWGRRYDLMEDKAGKPVH